jgi:hypothetical protein
MSKKKILRVVAMSKINSRHSNRQTQTEEKD